MPNDYALLRSFTSPVGANAAAMYLRAAGVPAVATPAIDALTGTSARLEVPHAYITQAAEVLREFLASPAKLDPAWESRLLPDLTKLDRNITLHCVTCNELLPLDAGLKACPSCQTPVDIPELLTTQYGPEVVELCYDTIDGPLEGSVLDGQSVTNDEHCSSETATLVAADLRCPSCGYNLASLPIVAVCPECGADYDKHDVLLGGR